LYSDVSVPSAPVLANPVHGDGKNLDILCRGEFGTSRGEEKARVIGLAATRRGWFVDHEVAAVQLDNFLELLNGVFDGGDVVRRFISPQVHSPRGQSRRHFTGDAIQFLPLCCMVVVHVRPLECDVLAENPGGLQLGIPSKTEQPLDFAHGE
jgi:hypothetical protein